MTIWADADALPGAARDILFRAAERTETPLVLVANKRLRVPMSKFIRYQPVNIGADVADSYIVQNLDPSDLVITADVPLADLVVKAGATALNPRGQTYDEASIGERLAMRNLAQDLRDAGAKGGGPPPFDARAKQDFANALDRWLQQALRHRKS